MLKIKKAFTLVELLLVVGLIALGSTVAYVTYNKLYPQYKANQETKKINTLRAGLDTYYGAKKGFDGITDAQVIAAKLAPESMISSDRTSLINGYGGVTAVLWYNGFDTTINTMGAIWTTNVPTTACMAMVAGASRNSNLIMMAHPNWTAFGSWINYSPNCVNSFPKDGNPSIAANLCSGGDRNGPGTSETVNLLYIANNNPAHTSIICSDGSLN